MPPACAMAMASLASVTVSMADDRMGMCSEIVRVTRVLTSTVLGRTSEAAGRISTSSKVSPSSTSRSSFVSGMGPSGISQPRLSALAGLTPHPPEAARLRRSGFGGASPVGGLLYQFDRGLGRRAGRDFRRELQGIPKHFFNNKDQAGRAP